MMQKPRMHNGLHHVALNVRKFEECSHFYVDLLGMQIAWKPDPNNLYLTSGNDNLALHSTTNEFAEDKNQRLDHLGFFLNTPEDVDAWHIFLRDNGVAIKTPPKDHRDGTRSFYCTDPDGNVVQMIYYPVV